MPDYTTAAFTIKLNPNVKISFYKTSPDRNEKNASFTLIHSSQACSIWNSLNHEQDISFLRTMHVLYHFLGNISLKAAQS